MSKPFVEAYKVAPGLYFGPAPRPGADVARSGFHVLALCAVENQPNEEQFAGVAVEHCPMHDDPVLGVTNKELRTAVNTATRIALHVAAGNKVLVTCRAGIDRSAFVTGLALLKLTNLTGEQVVHALRQARPIALSLNRHMRGIIEDAR
jgi:protein-tyrosine phosphatase